MAIRDLVGQEPIVQTLTGAVARRQVAHAYLLSGPEGIGKEFTALNLAQALNCGEGDDACCHCRSCRRIEAGSHPDVKIIRPDGASIKIEQVRQLQMDIVSQPIEGRYKVYILAEAERLTLPAANCLLKTLEEPPPYAVLLLLTARLAALLPTVVSRCQLLRFSPVAPELIEAHLIRAAGKTPTEARLIASLTGGIIGAALAMAASGDFDRRRGEAAALAESITREGYAGLPELSRRLEKESEGGREQYLDLLQIFFRDMMVWQETGAADLLVNQDRLAIFQEFGPGYTRSELLAFVQAIERTKTRIRQNINPSLALQSLLLHLTQAR